MPAIIINTEEQWIKVDDDISMTYSTQSPIGTAIRLLEKLLKVQKRRTGDLTERTR